MKAFQKWTVHNDENAKAGFAGKTRAGAVKRSALGEIGNTLTARDPITGKAGAGGAGMKAFGRKKSENDFQLDSLSSDVHAVLGVDDALDIDAADRGDQFACVEYTNDIDRHLRHAEGRYMVSPTYMSTQTEINEKMRAILIDWLVEVHLKFKLRHETLFLTVNILDRFLEKQKVARNKLQLVGVTSLMIAAKYEEIYPPEVRDYVYICDNAYTRNQILQMEPLILNRLGFRFTVCTPHTCLRRFCKAAAGHEGDIKLYNMASYILELSLLEYSMIKTLPSVLVASAVSIACRMLGRPSWSPTLTKYTRYTESTLLPVKDELNAILRKVGEASLKAVHKKYCSSKYDSVATIPVA